jgi:glycyl-tRNA synthetase beta chain
MIDFLLEIGFEEFPPSFLPTSAQDLTDKVESMLKQERIFYRTVRTIYTARRIGLIVLGLSRKQKSQTIEIQGPPQKFAFDQNGNPTQVLQGFLKSNDLKRTDIKIIKTAKGEYISGHKEILPQDTEEILYRGIPKIIAGLEFPKTMIWNDTRIKFPRPIRWLVALLDRRPLRFEYAGVKADRYSMPNFHFSFEPIRLDKPREYISRLRHGGVVVDPNERRKIIITRIKQAATALKSEPRFNPEMIEEINCTVEYPDVVTGEFNPEFLDLPPEVLTTTLRVNGNLIWVKDTNKFICIFGAKKKAADNVKKGYTQVVNAKLNDALFFYKNDLKNGIENMRKQSQGMIWMENMGTVLDKTERLAKIADNLKTVASVNLSDLQQAARLCKADLLSEMVGEKDFTSLQGIMGYYYAHAAGENDLIAAIIKDHYLPRFIGDKLPATLEGQVLSFIDKLDNIIGAVLAGYKPTGSNDPLGLRRTGYAVIQLADQADIISPLYGEIEKVAGDWYRKPNIDMNFIKEFFNERFSRYFEDQEFRYDEINAVLNVWNGYVHDAHLRLAAIKKWRGKPEFEKLVIGQKRVRNILKGVDKAGTVDAGQFKEPAENNLFQSGQEVQARLSPHLEKKEYPEILNLLLDLRGDIDQFFDDVMVMCEDKALQRNRLALVNFIYQLFVRFADLSQIVIETEKKPK